MNTVLARWGNSLAVRIPKAIVEDLELRVGTPMSVSAHEGRLVIEPRSRAYSLEELVAGINEHNRHRATDWGRSLGCEEP